MILRIQIKKYAFQTIKNIYGINKITVKKIIGILGLPHMTPGINLNRRSINKHLKNILSTMRLEFRLRIIVFSRIILLIYNKTYRGMRHLQGLPTRGQRTHANGKTPKKLKLTGNNIPFKFKNYAPIIKNKIIKSKSTQKANIKQKKKVKLSVKQKGKLKAKQKLLRKKQKKDEKN